MLRHHKTAFAFLLSMLIAAMVAPILVHAQSSVVLLEPLPTLPSGPTDLGTYLNAILQLAVGVTTAMAVVMIVWGGVEYMTKDSIQKKTDGKDRMKFAIGGMILAFGAFILLQTISPDLVDFRLQQTIQEARDAALKGIQQRPQTTDVGEPWGAGDKDDSAVRRTLGLNGVQVNKQNCPYVDDTNCTSVWNLDRMPTVIPGLIKISKVVNQSVWITGGTEYWLHKTHNPWRPIVDIRPNHKLDSYIIHSTSVGITEAELHQAAASAPINMGVLYPCRQDPATGKDVFEVFKSDFFGATFQWEPAGCGGSTGDHWHVIF